MGVSVPVFPAVVLQTVCSAIKLTEYFAEVCHILLHQVNTVSAAPVNCQNSGFHGESKLI